MNGKISIEEIVKVAEVASNGRGGGIEIGEEPGGVYIHAYGVAWTDETSAIIGTLWQNEIETGLCNSGVITVHVNREDIVDKVIVTVNKVCPHTKGLK